MGFRVEMARRQLPRLSIDATLVVSSPPPAYCASPTSDPSSARASVSTSFNTTPSSAGIFHVLCLYDFTAGDEDQLSFKKNEILDIVKQEDSGWWAALRENDHTVGWIPSAYVQPISEATAEHLRTDKYDVRVQETREKPYYTSNALLDDYVPSPADAMREFDWMPLDGAKSSPRIAKGNGLSPGGNMHLFPSDATSPVYSPLVPGKEAAPIYTEEPEGEHSQIIEMYSKPLPYPPSPSTPMPTPPPKSGTFNNHHDSRPIPRRSLSTPLPASSHSPIKARADNNSPSSLLMNRHRRRRPVLIDDSNSLSRLSTLIESSNVEEVDFLASSPVVAESIEAYSPVRMMARSHTPKPDKVRQITGDDEAQALYDAWAGKGNTPWYLRSEFSAEELKLEFNGTVSAGTVPALVERLTSEPLRPSQGPPFRHAFLTSYKTFSTPDEIFDLLLSRYYMKQPAGLSDAEQVLWREKKCFPTQKRVLLVFATWLEHHRMVQDDPPVARRLQEFLASIVEPAANRVLAKQVMGVLERITFESPSSESPKSGKSPTKRKKTKTIKPSELTKMDPAKVAEHLCLYDHKLYSKIHPQECFDWIKRQTRLPDKEGNLNVFIGTHDRVATWVKTTILDTEKVTKRADVVDFWIRVAEKCRAMNNYASVSALVTALSSVVITRLSLTWAYVGRTSQLDNLIKCNDPAGNFSAFRILQQAVVDGPCVPFVGMYLTDITHINDQYLDNTVIGFGAGNGNGSGSSGSSGFSSSSLSSGSTSSLGSGSSLGSDGMGTGMGTGSGTMGTTLVNFVKRQRWSDVISAMLQHQGKAYSFSEDAATMAFIEAGLSMADDIDTDMFWPKSQEVQQNEIECADIRKGLEMAGF